MVLYVGEQSNWQNIILFLSICVTRYLNRTSELETQEIQRTLKIGSHMHPLVFLVLFVSTFRRQQEFPDHNNHERINKKNMVNLHGRTCVRSFARMRNRAHDAPMERPPDPQTLLMRGDLQQERIHVLQDWISTKSNILTLTGAGLSTESGIPDYRGSKGSYHEGHKPMIHDQFISSASQRKRYWGRGMVGWRKFNEMQPNEGHYALTKLEARGTLGVMFPDAAEYHEEEESYLFGTGQQQMTIITQNVDNLHHRAGAKHITELHGRTGRLKCMSCGAHHSRQEFTEDLEDMNREWLDEALSRYQSDELRPDGDAKLAYENYDDLNIPSCPTCQVGFLKPDVVFFGDSVPRHRVERCKAAVRASDGLLCIGTSLSVHSALRFVKLASSEDIPICILNVGETRAEVEGISGITKVEAPIGNTLAALVDLLAAEDTDTRSSSNE